MRLSTKTIRAARAVERWNSQINIQVRSSRDDSIIGLFIRDNAVLEQFGLAVPHDWSSQSVAAAILSLVAIGRARHGGVTDIPSAEQLLREHEREDNEGVWFAPTPPFTPAPDEDSAKHEEA